MSDTTIEQAIRNSIEAELAAARFYDLLAGSTNDPEARLFLEQMREDEVKHAKAIEELSKRVIDTSLPIRAQPGCELIETAPAWRFADDVDYVSALRVALEAEQSAALYYSAIAEAFTGEHKKFFEDLSATEELHAERIQKVLERVVID